MKYDAEELYGRLNAEEKVGLEVALVNNDAGFQCLETEGTITRKDGQVHFIYEVDESTEDDLPLHSDDDDAFNALKNGKKNCIICEEKDGDEYEYLYLFYDEDEEDDAMRSACIELLRFANIDTLGRARALIRKGMEMYEKWAEVDDFIFSDEYEEDL